MLWDDLAAADILHQESRDLRVGPSDARVLMPGRGCQRQLAYRVQQVEPTDPIPDWFTRATILGTILHDGVAAARRLAHPEWMIEAEIEVPGFDRAGTVDAIDIETGTVDDLKTKSGPAFDRMAERGAAAEEDQRQVELYALGWAALGGEPERLSVTYLNRSNGEEYTDSWSWDPVVAERTALAMYAVIDRTADTPPEDIERGGRVPHWSPCDSCRWRARCWGIPPGEAGERVVSDRAAPVEVAAAARQIRVLRAARAEIQGAIDYCREMLLSHHGVVFEDADGTKRQVRWSAGRAPGEGGPLDQHAARAILEHYGEIPPTLGVAPRLSLPAVP